MPKISVDESLSPENCREKGYQWWQDKIYDPEGPKETSEEFIQLIQKGWKLGKPASKELEANNGVGLYKPLNVTI